MHIESLRYFIELARVGSFYGAAKSSYISHQGMNRAITSLESELGLKLVERSRQGARLTSDGEVFLRHAKRISAEYDLMMDDLFGPDFDGQRDYDPIPAYVSYYAAQTAVANPAYVGLLASNLSYIEESFDKLLIRAQNSDGNDLIYLDLHANTIDKVLARGDVVFEPIVKTRFGFVWKQGSVLDGEEMLHRNIVSKMPVAINAFREMAQLTDWLFRDEPLQNVRMGATSPRMLLEYVRSSSADAIAAFDSFGFFLSQLDRNMPTDGLCFTPLSTPESICMAGFLYPSHVKLSPRARHTVDVLKRFIQSNCAVYCERYPID